MEEQKRGGALWFYAVVAVVGIILLLIILQPKNQEGQNNDAATSDDAASQESADEPSDNVTTFDYLLPGEWDLTDRAEDAVNRYLDDGQNLNFGIIEHPEKPLAYFSTTAYNEENDTMMLSVYEYNTETYNFQRKYRATFEKGDISYLPDTMLPVARVLGYDKGRVIMLIQATDDSPGPCSEPLLFGDSEYRRIVAMDLNDPYAGFEDYEIPDDVKQTAIEKADTCLEEFE